MLEENEVGSASVRKIPGKSHHINITLPVKIYYLETAMLAQMDGTMKTIT